MALCPFATKRLLPESFTQRKIVPRAIIDHTAAGGSDTLYDMWQQSGLECHFYVQYDGGLEQYIDTDVRADANLEANSFAISIETANSREATNAYYRQGQHGAFESDPWTTAQLDTLKRLHAWLADTHPTIKRQRIPDAYGSGLGYHSMWGGGPTPWIPYSSRGKTCPGRDRIAQWRSILLPAFVGGTAQPPPEEEDMTPEQVTMLKEAREAAQRADVRTDAILKAIVGDNPKLGDMPKRTVASLRRIEDELGLNK